MKKKVSFISIVTILLFLLSGCGNTDVSLNTKINKNGSIDVVSKTETTNTLSDLLLKGAQINMSILNIENENSKSKLYKEDGRTISEFAYHFKNYKELNSAFSNISQDNIKFQVVKHKGFLHNTYDFSVNVQNSLTPENVNNKITSELNKKGIPVDSSKLKSINDSITNSITLSNSLSIPGKVTKSNGDISGGTVTWKYPLKDIKENTNMNATFKVINPVGLVILLVIILILVSSVIIFYYLHKKRTHNKSGN